jgi:tetratricopeptide (TPR) repeat protein
VGWVVWIGVVTCQTARVWRNSLTLWTDTLEKDFNNATGHFNLGLYLYNNQKPDQAAVQMLLATSIHPQYDLPLNLLGIYYHTKGLDKLAIRHFHSAIAANPDNYQPINNLGRIYAEKGEWAKALHLFSWAISINPQNTDPYGNIATLYLHLHQWPKAGEMAQFMISQFPSSPAGYIKLAESLEMAGRLEEAYATWNQALGRAFQDSQSIKAIEAEIARLKNQIQNGSEAQTAPSKNVNRK